MKDKHWHQRLLSIKYLETKALVMRSGVMYWHRVKDLVQKLKGSVQMDFNPTRGLFYALTPVVGAPALNKGKPKDTQTSQVVNSYPRRGRQTNGRSDATD